MKLLSGVLAAGLAALTVSPAVQAVAAQAEQSWSIAVHLAYVDGSEYDIVVQTGVPTREVPAYLAWCGQSHRVGSVVRFHCYPIAE